MLHIIPDCDLTRYNTFGLSVRCDQLVMYSRPSDLRFLRSHDAFKRPFLCIGEGANLLFTADYHGTVLRCTATQYSLSQLLTRYSVADEEYIDDVEAPEAGADEVYLFASAGCVMDDMVRFAVSHGLWGIENLSGIPGMTGGATVQNIGAYGVELKDVVARVHYFDTLTGTFGHVGPEKCRFGYRSSAFKDPEARQRFVITGLTMRLSRTPRPQLGYGALRAAVETVSADPSAPTAAEVRDAIITLRDSKLPSPRVAGSAGSYFKNPVMDAAAFARIVATARALWGDDTEVPHYCQADGSVKVPAAWFIDRLGWKGRTLGGAAVWERQPLVIVNAAFTARPGDIKALAAAIIDDVMSTFGVELSPEVVYVE